MTKCQEDMMVKNGEERRSWAEWVDEERGIGKA